jgi:hypothetical protein
MDSCHIEVLQGIKKPVAASSRNNTTKEYGDEKRPIPFHS